MNKEDEWDHMVETGVVEGPVEKVARNEIVETMQTMKSEKATGPSEVRVEMIVASGEIGVKVMMELCQRILDGKEMPDEWKTSVIVPIFKGKGNVISCESYRGVKLLEHAMKIFERVPERRIRTLVNLNEIQLGFMPGKGTMDAIFIVRRMQEEYQKKDNKLYMCFVDMQQAFDRVPRKVIEWAMRKKGLSEIMVRTVMSLYDGAKTKVRVGSAYSEEFEVRLGVHQWSVLSPLVFAIVVDVIAENARRGVVNELLYADDLVFMSENMEEIKERFWNWKDALESNGLNVNTRKTKLMVSGSEEELFKSKLDLCGVCGRRVIANLVCAQNVKTGFMENVQKQRELPLGWQCILFA